MYRIVPVEISTGPAIELWSTVDQACARARTIRAWSKWRGRLLAVLDDAGRPMGYYSWGEGCTLQEAYRDAQRRRAAG